MSSSAEVIHCHSRLLINPSHYAFGVRHPNWLLHAEARGTGVRWCRLRPGGDSDPPLRKNNRWLLTVIPRGWLLGVRHTYLIFKDHFVTCSRQSSRVFSVGLCSPPHISINSAGETCVQLSLKPTQLRWRTRPSNHCMQHILLLAIGMPRPPPG